MSSDEPKDPVWRGRMLRYAPLLIWITVIFAASTTVASMSNTSRFIRPLLRFLFPGTPEEILAIYHGYIRKSAHFVEYAILAFWAARAFRGSLKAFLARYWPGFALLLVLLVSAADEFNQSFDPSRTGTPRDVALDLFGGFCMIVVLTIFWNLKGRGRQ